MMFSDFGGRPGPPPQWNQPHPHHQMYPPHHHPQGPAPHMPMGGPGFANRPRVDPTSDVFTCLFGDLFVKW